MALPSSGAISLSDVNVELGLSATAQISLNDSAVRTLFGIASGAIDMDTGHGKANQFAFTISSNQTNANLATLATNAGWNGSSKVVATIDSGIYISSNSTGTPALTVNGSFAGGVDLINNGTIVGMGGNGGNGRHYNGSGLTAGSAGGTALSVSSAITITNNGTIAGGGGGGGGGNKSSQYFAGGGGGGGGRSSLTNSSGGSGGPSASGSQSYGGGTGGAGTISAAGGGGGGGRYWEFYAGYWYGTAGGAGGDWGASGSSSAAGGGAGGGAVSGNTNITWVSTGTRYGGIS